MSYIMSARFMTMSRSMNLAWGSIKELRRILAPCSCSYEASIEDLYKDLISPLPGSTSASHSFCIALVASPAGKSL